MKGCWFVSYVRHEVKEQKYKRVAQIVICLDETFGSPNFRRNPRMNPGSRLIDGIIMIWLQPRLSCAARARCEGQWVLLGTQRWSPLSENSSECSAGRPPGGGGTSVSPMTWLDPAECQVLALKSIMDMY